MRAVFAATILISVLSVLCTLVAVSKLQVRVRLRALPTWREKMRAPTPPLANCVPRKVIVTGAGVLAAVRAANAAWTSNDTYVETLEDLVLYGVRVVPATEFEPAFPVREEPTWRERARAIHAGSWRWGVHEDDHGKPADGMARYQARFGTPESPPGVAIFEDVLVNDVGDVKGIIEGRCACCLFFIKGCFSPVGKHALQQRDIVAKWDSTPEHAEVISVACRHLAFYHIVMDSLTRVAMVESTLRQHPHIKLHNAWRGPQWGLRLPLQHELNTLLLGIAPERIVTGSVRAKRLIVPERAVCYRHSPLVIQRASAIMRGHVKAAARAHRRSSTDRAGTHYMYMYVRMYVWLCVYIYLTNMCRAGCTCAAFICGATRVWSWLYVYIYIYIYIYLYIYL